MNNETIAKEFFVKKDGKLAINKELTLPVFDSIQASVAFLVLVIREWRSNQIFPVRGGGDWVAEMNARERGVPVEDSLWFAYEKNCRCNMCVLTIEMLDKIFGSHTIFSSLSFVDCGKLSFGGNDWFKISFKKLKMFAGVTV